MSDEIIISVENLGKRYRIQHQGEQQRYVALRDVVAQKAKSWFSSWKLAASSSAPSPICQLPTPTSQR
jgi:hypothetical protein